MNGGKLFVGIFLMALLVGLAGCNKDDNSSSSSSAAYSHSEDYLASVSWEDGSPISSESITYSKGEDIDLVLNVENHGPTIIPKNKILFRLLGEASQEFEFKGGKAAIHPKEDIDAYDFAIDKVYAASVDLPTIRYNGDTPVKLSKTIEAAYCYESPVKVKTKIVFTDQEEEIPGGTTGNQINTGDNPSADVKVITLQQSPIKVRKGKEATLDFYITISNVGGGDIRDGLSNCFDYTKPSHKEQLSFNVQGPYTVDCGDKNINLVDGEKQIKCTMKGIKTSAIDDKERNLIITLEDFAYRKEVSPVTIWIEGDNS
jgi:hypothetical protein